jgi:hypothetical protein
MASPRLVLRSALGAALLVLLAPAVASAYPQWQFSSGTSRCGQCHFSPAGGGLINEYGRSAAGEELSTWQGNGGFLHGAAELPGWLALGGDVRGVYLQHDAANPDGPLSAIFPMQADAYARLGFGEVSVMLNAGYRGRVRNPPSLIEPGNYQPTSAASFVSREHYIMWRAGALGPYVRAGRFFAPYGLRLVEHPTYVRRDLGHNTMQETYGLSGGFNQKEWELHLTAYVPDLLRDDGGREIGAAAMFEYRFDDAYALGVQARGGKTDDLTRYGGGLFGKAYFEKIKTILMAEVNLIQLRGASGEPSNQLIGYFGPTILPGRGFWIGAYGEVSQTDISIKDSATLAGTGQINWFPYPHFEVLLLGRLQAPTKQESAKTFMFQLHYYL